MNFLFTQHHLMKTLSLFKWSELYSLEGLMLKLKPQYFGTWSEELTHLIRPWCWERSKAGEEGDNRGWDDWMASLTQWTWVWVNSESWWWTGRPGMLQSIGSQRVRHNWATELNYHFIIIQGSNIFFCIFYFIVLVYLTVLMRRTHYHNYHSFMLSFDNS